MSIAATNSFWGCFFHFYSLKIPKNERKVVINIKTFNCNPEEIDQPCLVDLINLQELATPDNGPGADDYERLLMYCPECKGFFIQQFIEWWSHDGNDSMTTIYIPITLKTLENVNSQGWSDIRSLNTFYQVGRGWVIRK